MKALLIATGTSLLLAACATPEVVKTKQVRDESLSCSELKTAYAEAQNFEEAARKERGVTGTNVAAAVLFWPALIGTYKNTEDAIEAAKARQKHLEGVAASKNCRVV